MMAHTLNTMSQEARKQLFRETCSPRYKKRWSEGKTCTTVKEKRSECTPASMLLVVFAPARNAVTFTDALPGITGARNPQYGDAAPGLKMGQVHMMHLQFLKKNCSRLR